jgi:hypothetical protein
MPSATYSRSSILTLVKCAFGASGALLSALGALTAFNGLTSDQALSSWAGISGGVPMLGLSAVMVTAAIVAYIGNVVADIASRLPHSDTARSQPTATLSERPAWYAQPPAHE